MYRSFSTSLRPLQVLKSCGLPSGDVNDLRFEAAS